MVSGWQSFTYLGYVSTEHIKRYTSVRKRQKGQRLVNRYARIEWYTAITSVGLACLAGIYLAIITFAENETCYGISAVKIECHAIGSSNAAATAARLVVVLTMVLSLFAFAAAAARWQTLARGSDARVTAYMALVTCSVTVVAMVWAAFYGVGFFFLPSTLLIVAATISGLIALLQRPKDAADIGSSAR